MAFIKYFMLTGVLPVFLLFFAGLYIQPVSGDLTRLGNLPERDFGWNARQQQLTIKESIRTPSPKIVVVGDSFSIRNIWQSIAAENDERLTFLTFDWKSFSNNVGCLEKWLPTIKDEYPSCAVVIIETIERDFLGRFHSKNTRCPNNTKQPVSVKQGYTESIRTVDLMNAMPDPIYALKSIVNSLHEFKKIEKKKDVFVAPLTQSGLFSNKKSDLLLYYENDSLKKDWAKNEVQEAMDNAARIQHLAKNKGITLLFAVVPDKSTAYASYFRYPQFSVPPPNIWTEFDRQGINQIDLQQVLVPVVNAYQDLYLPNDTHIGSAGYMLMGKAISDRLNTYDSVAAFTQDQ